MKSLHLMGALLISVSLVSAQTENKTATVRIKKIENVNGVETISDTVYQIEGPIVLKEVSGEQVQEVEEIVDGKKQKMIIITDRQGGNEEQIKVIKEDAEMKWDMKDVPGEVSLDDKGTKTEKVMIMHVDAETEIKDGDKKTTRIFIMKKIIITEPSAEDTKMLSKETGVSDGKLDLEQMKFYPNPGNGKFNLNFDLKEKGNTSVNILNLEGKTIYNENLHDFSGHYEKEIDISENPKGVYFVRVEQGKHSQVKKIVLE